MKVYIAYSKRRYDEQTEFLGVFKKRIGAAIVVTTSFLTEIGEDELSDSWYDELDYLDIEFNTFEGARFVVSYDNIENGGGAWIKEMALQ